MNSSGKLIAAYLEAASEDVEVSLKALIQGCAGSAFFIDTVIVSPHPTEGDGRYRIAFSAYAPKGALVKQRTMHPVHIAIARVIELAGGHVKFHQPQPDANYQLRLRLDGIGTTNLTRILFDAGRSRDLIENRSKDYHDIVPANFVLRIGPDRNDVLEAIRPRDAELAELLRRLFVLANELHGRDLTETH